MSKKTKMPMTRCHFVHDLEDDAALCGASENGLWVTMEKDYVTCFRCWQRLLGQRFNALGTTGRVQ
jgi:hypothetical protein